MASRLRLSLTNPQAAEPERPLPALTSDLLEEIFLRVTAPADLARASTACVTFRRLIADHSFLRRYRSIHPPLLLGFVNPYGFYPVQAPHPSAAVAGAVARAPGFSFDHLPGATTKIEWFRWRSYDIRNGRVLVGCDNPKGPAYWELAVCDMLSRRYLLLPPITDDLLASVELQKHSMFHPRASFIPSGGPSGGIEEDTSFSVILGMHSRTRFVVLIFSSVSGCWSVSTSTNFDVLGLNRNYGPVVSGQCAYDCFYWKFYDMNMLIKLDMNTKQFSTVDLPPGYRVRERQIVIVELGESKVAMFCLSSEGTSVDYYTFSQNGSDNSHGWHMMRTIPLPVDYINNQRCSIWGPAEGYIFLGGIPIEQNAKHNFFSLEIKSFKIERIITTATAFDWLPYFGFPPSMHQ